MPIKGSTSFVLDSMRIIASLTVLFSHAMDQWFPSTQHGIEDNGPFAHAAVVVFFVLSGYVISFTTTSKKRGWKDYVVARFSRLTSVVYPALLLSIIAQLILKYWNPELLLSYYRGHDLIRYSLVALFSNEVWLLSAAPPINRPMWSLSFEFWYYLIFGAWLYRAKGYLGWIVLAVVCLIAGPKILAMMPIWIFGCFAYRAQKKDFGLLNWILSVLLIVASFFAMIYLPAFPKGIGSAPFYFANQFVTDWVVGAMFAVALWLLPNVELSILKDSFVNKYRVIADLTFPLYVLHLPLILLFRTLVPFKVNDYAQYFTCVFCIIIVAGILGYILEKQRYIWIKLFKKLFKV